MDDSLKLYHYTKVDTLLRYILPGLKLRMNSLINSNDPTELLLAETKAGSNSVGDRLLDVKSLSFCADGDGATSLRGYEIQPMWVSCAECWGGVCLEIDYYKLIANNLKIIGRHNVRHKRMVYADSSHKSGEILENFLRMNARRKSVELDEYVQSLLNNSNFVDERFFTKDRSWSYEQEFRFIALENYDEDVVFNLEGAVTAIILGSRFNVQLYPIIRDLVKEHGMDPDVIRKGAIDVKGCINELETYKSHYRANRVSAKKQKKKELDEEILNCIRDVQKSLLR